jgi:hypothetical protein
LAITMTALTRPSVMSSTTAETGAAPAEGEQPGLAIEVRLDHLGPLGRAPGDGEEEPRRIGRPHHRLGGGFGLALAVGKDHDVVC